MTTPHFPRRPEAPRVTLSGHDWDQLIQALTAWITEKVDPSSPPRLHVGALWGPRGSGKTSLLNTFYNCLRNAPTPRISLPIKDPQTKSPDPMLFAPELLGGEDGEHILAHILEFLFDHYQPIKDHQAALARPNSPAQPDPKKLLTEHLHNEIFITYEKDVAASAAKLLSDLQRRLSARATFSTNLRATIAACIPKDHWYLLLIDDIDLVPEHGPELLRTLHLYFGDLPIIVLITADREQFVTHLGAGLSKRHGVDNHHLAYQVLAKQVPYEWSVPVPDGSARLGALLGAQDDTLGMELRDAFAKATPSLKLGANRANRQRKDRTREHDEDDRAPRGIEPGDSRFDDPKQLLLPLLPPSWRGVNRTYNRLATVVERISPNGAREPDLKSLNDTRKRYAARLGCTDDLVIPLLAAIIAADEAVPEAALWQAFELEQQDLLSNLSHESLIGDSIPTKDPLLVAPLDRLRPPYLEGRALARARRVLRELAALWNLARETAKGGLRDYTRSELYAITASAGESAIDALSPEIRAQLKGLAHAKIHHIVVHDAAERRPDASDIQTQLRDPTLVLPNKPDVAVYAHASLSLMAWLGWSTRHHNHPISVLGRFQGALEGYSTEILKRIDGSIVEPQQLDMPIEVSFSDLPEGTKPASHEAAVIVEIRSDPDLKRSAPGFYRGDTKIVPELAYRLASPRHFVVDQDNIQTVVGDVRWFLDRLRQEKDIQRFHLALAAPNPVAFLIGRLLHPFTPVELYEYDPTGPAYRWVVSLG